MSGQLNALNMRMAEIETDLRLNSYCDTTEAAVAVLERLKHEAHVVITMAPLRHELAFLKLRKEQLLKESSNG